MRLIDFKIIIKVLSIAVICAVGACTTWRDFSKPEIASSKEWTLVFDRNNFDGFLTSQDRKIELHIDPINDGLSKGITVAPLPGVPLGTWGKKANHSVFEVSILIRSYINGYEFNPAMVELEFDGKSIRADRYSYRVGARGCFGRSHNQLYAVEESKPIVDRFHSIELYPAKIEVYDTCFNLYFSCPTPKTTENFSIQLGGIQRENKLLDVPKLIFSHGTRPSGW